MGNRGLIPGGKAAVAVTTDLQLVKGPENVDLLIHSPINFHGVVLSVEHRNISTFLTKYSIKQEHCSLFLVATELQGTPFRMKIDILFTTVRTFCLYPAAHVKSI
jgi:hypothetical protein